MNRLCFTHWETEFFNEKRKMKRPLGTASCSREDNIKVDITEKSCVC